MKKKTPKISTESYSVAVQLEQLEVFNLIVGLGRLVVWILKGSPYERKGYLGVPLESQTTKGPKPTSNNLRCAWKPGGSWGSSLAPYFEGILDTSSSLAPFQAPASN